MTEELEKSLGIDSNFIGFYHEGNMTFLDIRGIEEHLGRRLDKDEFSALTIMTESTIFSRRIHTTVVGMEKREMAVSDRTKSILRELSPEYAQDNPPPRENPRAQT